MTETDVLFEDLKRFTYPDTMIGIAGEIQGVAFFPGGKGTFNNSGKISDKKIMVLGQDFDCESNYQKALSNGSEDLQKNATWRNLLSFLNCVDISREDCFFTNGIMGIRKSEKGTGKSPAFDDEKFIEDCRYFFLKQLSIQRPKAILVLGKQVAEFLSSLADELHVWKKMRNFNTRDEQGLQVYKDVEFINGIKTNLVVLTHPSFWTSNVHRRKYKIYKGAEAEREMIKEILR